MNAPRTIQPMIGVSASADSGSDLWTFEMVGDYKVSAGRHAILIEGDYKKLKQSHDDLLDELNHMCRAYVRLLEAGRDRIRDFGGECDGVDVMERDDPNLRAARAVIAEATGEPNADPNS